MHANVLACLQSDPERAVGLLRGHFASAKELWRHDGSEP